MSDRFEQLLSEYLDGSLTRAASRELTSLVQNHPEKLKILMDMQAQDHLLPLAAEALDDALFIGSVQEAIREDEHQFVGKVKQDVQARNAGRRTWIPVFALAASLLVGFGIFLLLNSSPSTSANAQYARVIELQGGLSTGTGQSIQAGQTLARGQTLRTAPGARAALLLADGSRIDMNESTALSLPPVGAPEQLAVQTGKIYCQITSRASGAGPFVITGASGHRMEVLGTIFELSVADKHTALNVEQGTVRLRAGTQSVEVPALQAVVAADTTILPPRYMPISRIASWRFPDGLAPAGTVLFKDDMESGTVRWSRSPYLAIGEGLGVNDSRAARITVNHGVMLDLAYRPRCPNYEISFKYKVDNPDQLFAGFSLQGFGPAVATRYEAGSMFRPQNRTSPWPAGEWVDHTIVVHGREVQDVISAGGKVISSQPPSLLTGPWHSAGPRFGVESDAAGKAYPMPNIYVDNVVIRKLPGDPDLDSVANYVDADVIFRDNFPDAAPTNWTRYALLPKQDGLSLATLPPAQEAQAFRIVADKIRGKSVRALELSCAATGNNPIIAMCSRPILSDAFSVEFDTFLYPGTETQLLLTGVGAGSEKSKLLFRKSDFTLTQEWYRNRLEFLAGTDSAGDAYVEVRNMVNGDLIMHTIEFTDEFYPALSIRKGRMRVANVVLSQMVPRKWTE